MSLEQAALSRLGLERLAHALAGRQGCSDVLSRGPSNRRVFEQIWDEADANAWLICWNELQDTGWHDHDHSAAAILVLSGQVQEERLRLAGAPTARILGAGQTFYVPPSAIHRVLHTGAGPAVTIHVYSPPLARTGAYSLGPEGELQRLAQSYEEELRMEESMTLLEPAPAVTLTAR